MTTPIHENSLIKDYLGSRLFCGFELRVQKNKVVLISEDSTIINLLFRSKLIKEEEDSVEIDVMSILPKRTVIKKVAREMRSHYEQESIDLIEAMNAINAFSDPSVKQRLDEGYIAYADMPVLFTRGIEVIASTPSGFLGGIVESCVEISTFFGNYYNISLSCVLPTSKGCCMGRVGHRVYDFRFG